LGQSTRGRYYFYDLCTQQFYLKKDKKERENLIEDILRKMSYSSYIEAVAKQESELQKIRG